MPTVLDEHEKKEKALKIRDFMQKQATELNKLGYECFGLIIKPNTYHFAEFGTERASHLFHNSNSYWEFLSHVNVTQQERHQEDLRQAVGDKLNNAYKDSRFASARVPLKKVQEGSVEITGLPDGLKSNCASFFGIEDFKQILSADCAISFTEAQVGINSNETDKPDSGDEDSNQSQILSLTQLEPQILPLDCLLQKRMHKRKTQYLVKWPDFEEPTWEPFENIPAPIRRKFNSKEKIDM